MKLTIADFKKIGAKNADIYLPYINEFSEEFGVNTVNRILGFFPNILQETGNFIYSEELSSGKQYEGNVKLGNIFAGDGEKFKGRGLGMLTGRSNYTAFTKYCISKGYDVDFVNNPQKLKEPKWAVLSAFWFWEHNELEKYADKGDFQAVCAIWNTGDPTKTKINGWGDRVNRYEKVVNWLRDLIK